MSQSDRAWNHKDEINFIHRLGTISMQGAETGRETLLKRYRDSMEKRVNWGDIKKTEIRLAISEALKRC